jgi:hypothetical protein
MTARSPSARRSSGCARRRTAAPRVVSHSLKVSPKQHFVNYQQDPTATGWRGSCFPIRCGTQDRGGPCRRHDGLQSVRFLRRGQRGGMAVRLPGGHCPRSGHLPHARTGRSALQAFLDSVPREKRGRWISSSASTRGWPTRSATSSAWSRACRRRRKRSRPEGIVPRHQLAAGPGAAASRVCRALRVGLPDPAQAGPGGA